MAIMAPADLPSVLKVRSEPMKKFVLSKMGHPITEVEIEESQWETIWKVAGDFIAGYFPREQKLGTFWTSPLKSTYPLPSDAYWIESVSWDPVTTRIDDVFGAESFLFCLSPEFLVLDKDDRLQSLGNWKKSWKAKTPYGLSKLAIINRDNDKLLPKMRIHYESGVIEATCNHVIQSNDCWREFNEVHIGDSLAGIKNKTRVQNIEIFECVDAVSVRANQSGCYYGCVSGEPVLIH